MLDSKTVNIDRLIFAFLFFVLFAMQASAAPGEASIGTNIAMPKAYTRDLMFVDRMKQSTSWTAPLGEVEFDSNGYPLEVSSEEQQMNKLLFQGMAGIYPDGEYTLSWKGTGTVWVRSPATCPELPEGQCVISGKDVTRKITVPANNNMIQLKIVSSSAGDHIRDLNFIMPGFENDYLINPVHPDYLDSLREFSFVRAMDILYINHAEDIVEWEDRVTKGHSTYSEGVPWEIVFDIVNQIDRDLWINIPHKASDDYIINLIELINSELEPGRHIYVEYSNEVWNSIFPQFEYCLDMGREMFGQEIDAAQAVAWWNARRSAEIWQMFEDNLDGNRSMTRVISGQGVNSWRAEQSLSALDDIGINPTKQRADAVAIAYYFGAGVLDAYLTNDDSVPRSSITVSDIEGLMNHLDEILDLAEESIYGTRKEGIIDHAALAEKYGIRLVGYEGGQSFYIGQGYDQLVKNATTPILAALSKHPRMEDLYKKFLTVFFDNNGKEFANFSFINVPQSSGAWGIYDFSGDKEGLYKLAGLRAMMREIGQNLPLSSDVDSSGSITSSDALLVLRKSLGLDMARTSWQDSDARGDSNCDGIVNSSDATLILRYSLGFDMNETAWCVD